MNLGTDFEKSCGKWVKPGFKIFNPELTAEINHLMEQTSKYTKLLKVGQNTAWHLEKSIHRQKTPMLQFCSLLTTTAAR